MGRPITDLSFDQWLAFVFDHPVNPSLPEWYWDDASDWWNGPPRLTVRYLTQAFENAAQVMQPYTDAQLNQGLWYIASNTCSEHMFALLDPGVPWPERQRCVRSMHHLYEQCFLPRCSQTLGHLDEQPANPLNMVCYMWWDIIPIAGQPDDPQRHAIDQECLHVMASTLQLPSEACRESALHGLGHWARQYPDQTTAIIDDFLRRHTAIRDHCATMHCQHGLAACSKEIWHWRTL